MPNDPVSALVTIINSSTKELQSLYAQKGSQIPSLDAPFRPGPSDDDPKAIELSKLVVAAATQLIVTVRSAKDTLWDFSTAMYLPGAMGFVVDVNIPEILNEAPNQSLHVNDIAAAIDCDVTLTARVMRYLATRYIFKEVIPDSAAELKAKPLEKYENSGNAAFVGHSVDEGLKSSAYMAEFLKSSGKAAKSPFSLAYGTKKTLWDWYAEPEHTWRFGRFVGAMQNVATMYGDSIFQNAYDWKRLKSTDVVVDVGGNMGTVTLAIAKMFSQPKFVVQDLPPVIEGAKPFWQANFPEAIANGRVKLEAHDFFQPQPVKGAAVYFLRFVIQDWPDSESVKILKCVREAASASSKLILFETGVPYACTDPMQYEADVERRTAPYPLIPNLGKGGGLNPTNVDMQMMNLLNGQGRSIRQFIELGEATGWKLVSARNEEVSIFTFSAV
ncbi:Sterigmatocystin 8-O-methyltransferase [Leucoagaricus sp. SymC.cos]|nr:Sterigmatocystin 8-O-methyltransferase [Leucoagaricus sp. SymC.cos]